MPAGRLHTDLELTPALALARGKRVLEAVSPHFPVVAYGAELSAPSVVLGAHQHVGHALEPERLAGLAVPVVRRATGGGAVWASKGVLYLALGLLDASALMACPPGRILNRNVRGLLAGIRALGVPAFYFGRDFVSIGPGPAPGAVIGWSEESDGRVLLECFVANESSFELPDGLDGYPERSDPLWGGKRAVALRPLLPHPPDPTGLLETLLRGYERAYAARFEPAPPGTFDAPEDAGAPVGDVGDARGLSWSRPMPEAIGFVSAGVRLDEMGHLTHLELGGDFFQHAACPRELSSRLLGRAPLPEAVGAAIDAVYAVRPGLIEGVRSLTTLRSAILDACERWSDAIASG